MDIEERYQKALDYLYSFVDYSLTRAFRYSPEKFDLGRMKKLLEEIGDPHLKYPVIHLAGTKGKGSTAAMIASALTTAGYKTGLYTSPHLSDFAERIKIDGQQIDHSRFVDLVESIKSYAERVEQITTFELATAIAFWYFQQEKVDSAVIEVGLGGRLDATNLVDPVVSVITSLSYDHTAVLGKTLSEIAGEKGGIIKTGRPVVMSPQLDEARSVIEKIAEERQAPLTVVGKDVLYAPWTHSLDGQTLMVWDAAEQPLVNEFIESAGRSDWEPVRISIPLLGYHQVVNAATAYTALRVARAHGLQISNLQILDGFKKVSWPGRFEVLRRRPPVVVDSAHNRDSALKLRLSIDDYLPGIPVILLFGASEDKDVEGMFSELLPRVNRVIATESFHPRAMAADKLVELAHHFGRPAKAVLPLEDAFQAALDIADGEAAVVAAGSVFIAAAVRECWERMKCP